MESVARVLAFLGGLPPLLTYTLLGLGAALENIFPPVPADTFVLLGAFLSVSGKADPRVVWLVTWALNVGSALLVYWIGHRRGRLFFETGLGRHVLNAHQLERMTRFYQRFGASAVFFSRFLPGLRAVVPGFAGVSHQRFLPVAIPVALASGIWYGALVWLGATAGRNLPALIDWIRGTNLILIAVAVLVSVALAWWWLRTRAVRP